MGAYPTPFSLLGYEEDELTHKQMNKLNLQTNGSMNKVNFKKIDRKIDEQSDLTDKLTD